MRALATLTYFVRCLGWLREPISPDQHVAPPGLGPTRPAEAAQLNADQAAFPGATVNRPIPHLGCGYM